MSRFHKTGFYLTFYPSHTQTCPADFVPELERWKDGKMDAGDKIQTWKL